MQTNFFPFGIAGDSFQAQTLPYSAEKLRELRLEHNSEYSFFRYGESIVISPHSEAVPQLGTYHTFDPVEHPGLVGSLLRHLLFQEFRKKIADVIPTSFAPLEFPSRERTHDPIADLLPEKMGKVLEYPRVMSIAVEQITQRGKPKHGLLVSYRNRWQLSLTLEDLQRGGYPVVGSEVLAFEPLEGLEGVLTPKESLLGVVKELNGATARLETNEGVIERPLNELTIRRTRQQLATLLKLRISDAETDRIFKAVRAHGEKQANPEFMIGEIRRVGERISRLRFRNGDNFSAYTSSNSELNGPSYDLERTKLMFDYTPGTANDRPLSGLLKHGQFDSAKFDPKSPHVLVMFRASNRGAMTEFFGCLVSGLPDSKFFKKGFVTVSLKHPWIMYQRLEREDRRTSIEASDRCTNLILDNRCCLVQLKGNKDRTNWKHDLRCRQRFRFTRNRPTMICNTSRSKLWISPVCLGEAFSRASCR